MEKDAYLDWKPAPGGNCTECHEESKTLWYGIEKATKEDPIVAKSVCWTCVGRTETEMVELNEDSIS